MRKTIFPLFLLMAFMVVQRAEAQRALTPELRTDTLFRVDTVITNEVITRTEVIHKSEKIVRYYENGELRERKLDRFNNEEKGDSTILNPKKVEVLNPIEIETTYEADQQINDTIRNLGGKFVWVPDSMTSQVRTLLENGNSATEVLVDLEQKPVDLTEKVVFRGDTLNMVLKDRNLGRYDRGLFNYLFIPKGIWQVGLTASYGEFSTSDLQILDLISDIDFNGKLWSIRPYFQYFFKSNLSLGMRLGYTEGKANIGSFKVDIDEDMNFNLHDIMYKSTNYSASITFSQYLGITRKGRFGVFNEVELALSGGNSDFNRPFNGEMRKTHTNTFQAALNFSPGVCVYVLDQVSFNVSLGVFGLNIKHEKQKVNGEDLGWRTTSGANFRFNIFNINFGIAVNI